MRRFIASAVAGLILAMVSEVAFAYDPDVHYCLTYYLARKVGYTKDQAHRIASAALAVDNDAETEPLQVAKVPNPNRDAQTPRFRFHAFLDSRTYDQLYQTLRNNGLAEADAKRIADETAGAERERQQRALWTRATQHGNPGVYLHFLQDIPSHGKYYTRAGHGAAGHWPDFLSYDKDAGLQMTQLTVDALKRYMILYLPQEPVEPNWGDIMKLLRRLEEVNPHSSLPLGRTPDMNAGCIEVSRALDGDDPGPQIAYDLDEWGDPVGGDWALPGFRPQSGALRVKVFDDATGAPLSGAKVEVTFEGRDSVERSGVTQDGLVDFQTVPGESGAFRARARREGYGPGETSFRVEIGQPSVATLRLKPRPATTAPAEPAKTVWVRKPPIVASNNQNNRYPKNLQVTATSCSYTEETDGKRYTNTLSWTDPPERLEAGQVFELNMRATTNGPARGVGGWWNLGGVDTLKGLNGAGTSSSWRLPQSGGSPHDGTLTLRVRDNEAPWIQVSGGFDPAPETWVVITWEYERAADVKRTNPGGTFFLSLAPVKEEK